MLSWVVATQIFFIFTPKNWGRFPIWRSYFFKGVVQPPTSYLFMGLFDSSTWNRVWITCTFGGYIVVQSLWFACGQSPNSWWKSVTFKYVGWWLKDFFLFSPRKFVGDDPNLPYASFSDGWFNSTTNILGIFWVSLLMRGEKVSLRIVDLPKECQWKTIHGEFIPLLCINESSSFIWCIWVFPKIGVPQNRWFIMENPIKMDDLGGKPTIFGNTHIYTYVYWARCVFRAAFPPSNNGKWS